MYPNVGRDVPFCFIMCSEMLRFVILILRIIVYIYTIINSCVKDLLKGPLSYNL